MKLNTITKGIATCILTGTLVLGVNACNKPEEPKQETIQETIKHKEPVKEYVIKEKGYDDCKISLSPSSKTGQTLEVFASTWDSDKYNLWDVKEKRLYEDGKLIKTQKGDSSELEGISKKISHKEPGTHSYYAEFVYENDKVIKTRIKSIEFTGEVLDLPPTDQKVSVLNNELLLYAIDEGDNKGIIKIKVYENEKLWKEMKADAETWVVRTIPLDYNKKGKYSYQAEFTDKGGNTVETEAIVINYR